jgi:hypothetical protein
MSYIIIMNECYHHVEDVDEVKWYYDNVMQPLKPHEVWFLSCAARNKRLSEEERAYFQIGRSEMHNRVVVTKDAFEDFLRGLRKLEANKLAYTTKNGLSYPSKSLVLYANIVPSDAYRAMKEHLNEVINIQSLLTDSVLKGSNKGIEDAWYGVRHSHSIGQSVFARSFSEGEWLDVDADFEGEFPDLHEWFAKEFELRNFVFVSTAGGVHIMLRKSALKTVGSRIKNDPVKYVIETVSNALKESGAVVNEVVRNQNFMIPLPGTLQYGDHLVRVFNKNDFR